MISEELHSVFATNVQPLVRPPESESLLARCFAEFGASLGAASFLHQSSCCGLRFLLTSIQIGRSNMQGR